MNTENLASVATVLLPLKQTKYRKQIFLITVQKAILHISVFKFRLDSQETVLINMCYPYFWNFACILIYKNIISLQQHLN
jgi:hypothetical protein